MADYDECLQTKVKVVLTSIDTITR